MNIGIDLGTSYSSVAAEVKGKIEMIRVATGANAFGDSFSMPTAVYMDNGDILLGQAALNKRKVSPSCFKSEFKRDFGTATPYIMGGEEYLPEQLYTELLMYFKNQAAKQMGEKIEKVYITHPANYGNNKKRLIEKAANNAGLFDVVLVDEPTAAAAGYSQKNKIIDGDILLVYDLGGGTFDAAIIKKTAKGYIHLTEPLGISQCGGVDFDRAIFDDIMNKMSQSGTFDIDRIMQEKRFTATLSEICIGIKHQLSQAQSHTEPIAVGFDYFDYKITRQEFERMIHPFIANTCEKAKDILKNSGLSASDIDKVLLVGGSSRVPLVQRMVCDALKKEASFDADPELAVCQGAVCIGITQPKEEISERNIKEKQPEEFQNKDIKPNKMEQNKQQGQEIIQKKEEVKHETKEERQKPDKQQKIESIIPQKSEAVESAKRMQELMAGVILGNYASDGEWIYYVEDGYVKASGTLFKLYNLCKIKLDGTQKTKLNDRLTEYPVRVEGEWVYYSVYTVETNTTGSSNFYRIKKDGTGETKISNVYKNKQKDTDVKYALKDGWIYFINDSNNLLKMRVDGSCSTRFVSDTLVYEVNIKKDWVYYRFYTNHNFCLVRIGIDGTKKTEICRGPIYAFDIFNDWVVYKTFEEEKKLLQKISKWELRIVQVDGANNRKVLDGFHSKFVILDGWLYYEHTMSICRMCIDGTEVQEVSPEMMKQVIAEIKKP